MNMDIIRVKNYEKPPFDKGEIMRYMGCHEASLQTLDLIDQCIGEIKDKLSYKVCFRSMSMEEFLACGENENMPFGSSALCKNLDGCICVIIFAATIGIGMDRLINRYSRISPVKALCFQAIGAERIESLCNLFNKELKEEKAKEGLLIRPRFSPGYGDFPLSVQKEFFRLLECPRKIGLTLNDSLLMSPSKSVTAVIGIYDPADKGKNATEALCHDAQNSGCNACHNKDCEFRRK